MKPGQGRDLLGYCWFAGKPRGDVIHYRLPWRSAKYLDSIIDEAFEDTFECGVYKSYPSFPKQRAGPLELAGFRAHAPCKSNNAGAHCS